MIFISGNFENNCLGKENRGQKSPFREKIVHFAYRSVFHVIKKTQNFDKNLTGKKFRQESASEASAFLSMQNSFERINCGQKRERSERCAFSCKILSFLLIK